MLFHDLIEKELPLPAYEMVLKASHSFNLLDARHSISVTERQRFILRVRVRDMLQEYATHSNGMLKLIITDPETFSR